MSACASVVRGLSGMAFLLLCASSALAVSTTELLMLEEPGCVWCRRWRAEVGDSYSKSVEGQLAPLRVINLHGPRPAGVVLAAPIIASPTFVLVQSGFEVGRITGYPGADFFWGMLGELFRKLDQADTVPR